MFVEKFQILLGEKKHVGGIFFFLINRRVDMLIRATRVRKVVIEGMSCQLPISSITTFLTLEYVAKNRMF